MTNTTSEAIKMNVVYESTTNFEPPPEKKRNVNIVFFFMSVLCSPHITIFDSHFILLLVFIHFAFYSPPPPPSPMLLPSSFHPHQKKIISYTRTEISEQQNRLWKFLRCRCEQNCSHLVLSHIHKMMSGLGKDLKEFKTHTYIHTHSK